jgi:hypothetical protein
MKRRAKPKSFWMGFAIPAKDVRFIVLCPEPPKGRFCAVGDMSFQPATAKRLDLVFDEARQLLMLPDFPPAPKRKKRAKKSSTRARGRR